VTATATAARRQFRVHCAEHDRPCTSAEQAIRVLTDIELSGHCQQAHTAETLVDGQWLPLHIARAREILAAPLATVFDDLMVTHRTWPPAAEATPAFRQRLAANAAAGMPVFEAYSAALGPAAAVTLTADGRGARRDGWCRCPDAEGDDDSWIRYEHWTAEGRHAHGFLCRTCRFIKQSG